MNLLNFKIICLLGVVFLPAIRAGSDSKLTIGPTRIPFYTGNLSILSFMNYWGTHGPPVNPQDWASPERIEILKRISCVADCDYPSWALAQQEPDKWDFTLFQKNADALHAAGLKYVIFCWVHFPPKWFLESPDFVPYECAEHGKKLHQLSPWGPNVWDIYRKFYEAQRKAMGDKIDWIRVATPSDYGEIGYPAAMTSWLVPQDHAHPGYWCGDPYARADFRDQMRKRFRRLKALNERWGTLFESWEEVTYPELVDEKGALVARESGKAADRRRWLDFIDWYYGVWLRFTPKLTSLIREFYPEKPMIVSVGYASEKTHYGNDYSALPKMASKIAAALQTPGSVSYYAQKRVSTACHFYDCPYYTEPPGDVPPDAEVARVFSDVSNGVQVYFEYPNNLDRARVKLRAYKNHMTGARPVVDLAIFNPTIDHRLHCGKDNFPLNAFLLGEKGRDRFDFDVLDEQLIRDGALANYRVLVYAQGNVTEDFALRSIADWVRRGGALVTCKIGDVETVEGDKSIWSAMMPGSGETNRVGRGVVIRAPVGPDKRDALIDAVEHAAHHLSDFGKQFKNAPLIDGIQDRIHATLLPDRILYFNGTDEQITKKVTLRPEDWSDREKNPEKMEYELRLAPHSIEAIWLE